METYKKKGSASEGQAATRLRLSPRVFVDGANLSGTLNPAYLTDGDSTSNSSNDTNFGRPQQLSPWRQGVALDPSVLPYAKVRNLNSRALKGTPSSRNHNPRRTVARQKGHQRMNEDENDSIIMDDRVVVERPIYTELEFERGFEMSKRPKRNPHTWIKKKIHKWKCSPSCIGLFFLQFFPFVHIMRKYKIRRDLPRDIVSGLTVGIMHIPQGMAYGQLTTLPPVFGLYTSFFPVIIYFFLGTSKHISMGTFAVVSLMIGSVVDKGMISRGLASRSWNETVQEDGNVTFQIMDNSDEILKAKLAFAMAVSFGAGCVQILLGILRLGFVTVYLSDPLISGFTTGAACHVFTSQIKHIFGIKMGSYYGVLKLVYSYRDFFVNLPETNAVTLIASVVCIIVLVVVKEYISNNPKVKSKLKMPIPVELIVVVLGTLISYFVGLEEKYKVKVVGEVPLGIPSPNANQVLYLGEVLSDTVAIGIVAFAISVSMAKILAKKHDYEINANQELIAYGLCNITSSFFSSFCAAASLSRSLVQESVGGKTQVTGLVSSALLLIVLLVLGTYFEALPNCVLASIITVALKGMFMQFLDLKRLWNISIIDFAVWLVSFIGTVLLDVDLGLLVGVIFALSTVIFRSQRPYVCLLGQVPGTDLYKDIAIFKVVEELQHIKIFRFECALFFANSEYFKALLYKMTVDPSRLRKLKKKADKEKKGLPMIETIQLLNTRSIRIEPEPTPTDQSSVEPTLSDNVVQSVNVSEPEDPNPPKEFAIGLPTLTDVYFIIIDCTTMSYVDSVGVRVLQQVIAEMRTYSINVFLAQCKAGVREMFERTDFYKTSDKECLFLTIHDAVLHAQRLMQIASGIEEDELSVRMLEDVQEPHLEDGTSNANCIAFASNTDTAVPSGVTITSSDIITPSLNSHNPLV